jgi:hypothetical protein
MKIDMSVKEIMESSDLVIGRVITHEVTNRGIPALTTWEGFREASYSLLREVEGVKRKIYGQEESAVALLTYLTVVLEREEVIGWAARLLEEE